MKENMSEVMAAPCSVSLRGRRRLSSAMEREIERPTSTPENIPTEVNERGRKEGRSELEKRADWEEKEWRTDDEKRP